MYPASSCNNMEIRWATSAGVPTRCNGIVLRARASRSDPVGLNPRYASVSMGPGATAFTVMPCGASSPAQMRVHVSSAAFAAAYGVRSATPSVTRLERLTMRPHPASIMPGSNACTTCTGDAHIHVVGGEQVVQVDRADVTELLEANVVYYSVDS